MKSKKHKLRCRKNGIVVSSKPENYDLVWKREYKPNIYPMDIIDNKKDNHAI